MNRPSQIDAARFDYVIVGGGSAGCVLANRLSADPSSQVLLLEAGGKDDYLWIHIPVGYLYCIGNPKTDWCYHTEPQPGLNGRSLAYARGRVIGGSSSINGMIYMRGQKRDYDEWRALGNLGWGADDVLPFFKRSEDFQLGAVGEHGAGGELRVEHQRLSWEILTAVQDAAEAAGLPKREDPTFTDEEGSGFFSVTQKAGLRWSAASAFLHPVEDRANLTVMTGAEASRILFEGRRATGVEYTWRGAIHRAHADGEVVLAAGAIGTPHLLELSGLGDARRLQALGVEPVRDMPGVGENLQDHLQLRCAFKVQGVPTLNEMSHSLFGKATIGVEYLLKRSGPMAMAPSQLGIFARSDPDRETPNLEFHVQPLSLDRFGEPLHPFPAFTAAACNLRPRSRGSVHSVSPDRAQAPAIDPNYLSDADDRAVAAASIRLTRAIVGQAPLARFAPDEFLPGADLVTDEQLAVAAGDVGTTIFHPVGTARMGLDRMAVVDERLRVHGVEGLRIIDASVMPTITSGNTNAPTIMIGEKGAAMILEDARGRYFAGVAERSRPASPALVASGSEG